MQIQRSGIHSSSVVAEGAEIGCDVTVGPGCVIGPHVRIGDRCMLHAQVVLQGATRLGDDCELFPGVVLGHRPQDKKLRLHAADLIRDGWMSEDGDWLGPLHIGANNELREHVTMQGGTPHGRGRTVVGDDNMFLASSHIGHDCEVGSHVVFTNGAMAAGHCRVADRVVLGAMAGVHQYGRIGRYAMIGAGAMLSHDAPPFALVQGDRARLVAVNVIGLKRAGFTTTQASRIKRAYRLLFWRGGLLNERLAAARAAAAGDPHCEELFRFVESSQRGVCGPRGRPLLGDEPHAEDRDP